MIVDILEIDDLELLVLNVGRQKRFDEMVKKLNVQMIMFVNIDCTNQD